MVNNIDRETYRSWKLALEIERFILDNADDEFRSRRLFYKNYFRTILELIRSQKIIIQRDEAGSIIALCGWIRFHKQDEWQINKIRWFFPSSESGENLYIAFCIISKGNVHKIRKELKERYEKIINEVSWYSIPKNKFVRIKNILKER